MTYPMARIHRHSALDLGAEWFSLHSLARPVCPPSRLWPGSFFSGTLHVLGRRLYRIPDTDGRAMGLNGFDVEEEAYLIVQAALDLP